jgi:hypothetical protein
VLIEAIDFKSPTFRAARKMGHPRSSHASSLRRVAHRLSASLLRTSVEYRRLRLLFSQDGDELARFWQPRFYDFNVYSERKKKEKLEYMHGNPVQRGLVKKPGEWMRSSFLFYARGEAGLVRIDPVE